MTCAWDRAFQALPLLTKKMISERSSRIGQEFTSQDFHNLSAQACVTRIYISHLATKHTHCRYEYVDMCTCTSLEIRDTFGGKDTRSCKLLVTATRKYT